MKQKFLPLLFLSFAVTASYSQSFVSKIIRGENGITKQFTPLDHDQAISFNVGQVKSLLNLNQNSDLVLLKTEQDKLGYIHYRYYQSYKGIPVENSMYIIHTKNGILKSLSGTIVTDFDAQINQRSTQRISDKQAIETAVRFVNAKVYAWQDAAMEQRIKEQMHNGKASYAPKASLVWFSASDDITPSQLRLCYKVDVYARQPLSRAYYYVDAITGNILGKKDEIFYSDATGTANTAYSGAQTVHSDYTGTKYRLRDYTKGSGIITLHGETSKRGNEYTSSTSNWTLSGDNIAALDAHYGVSQTYAFYMANFGRDSYDNLGTALYSYVNDPTYTDNAFWDGTAMNFNKRSTGEPGGVTGIDVTGHELSHGVTQESSGLNYSKEPGAINESMSDIMGKSVQFWSKPGDINWDLSNDMNWIIRSFSNPNSQGQPDTYKGLHWWTSSTDNYGVHTNSGVGNFMFYLLVNGGSGTNDNGDAYSVTGIGLAEADQIIYRTNNMYLTPTSKYADWRTACIAAATDLYGAASNEVTQVGNAWDAVGVGNATNSPYCTSAGTTDYEFIKKVVIGSISNTSKNNGGYANYTALSTNLAANNSSTIKLTPGFVGGSSYTEYWSVFIDYDQNNSFTDAGEKVATGHGASTVTKSFTVPSTAKNGPTRMRVIMHYGSVRSKPCGSFDYGEVEDYTVNITGGTLVPLASENSIKNTLANVILVTPNPVTGSSANIVLQTSKTTPVVLRISDFSGRVLRTENISNITVGKNNFRLTNLDLIPGTYMVIAEQNNMIIGRSQFIVAK